MIKNLLNADEAPETPAEDRPAPVDTFSLFAAVEPEIIPAPEDLPAITIKDRDWDQAPPQFDAAGWVDPAAPDPWTENETKDDGPSIVIAPYKPPSSVETIRRSGLAWSAGVIFFGSVAFLLILGWFADLLLGTSPWGIVVGIVLGSIVGFINFFRITSQILRDGQ